MGLSPASILFLCAPEHQPYLLSCSDLGAGDGVYSPLDPPDFDLSSYWEQSLFLLPSTRSPSLLMLNGLEPASENDRKASACQTFETASCSPWDPLLGPFLSVRKDAL